MRGRRLWLFGLSGIAVLAGADAARATFQPALFYDPPLIRVLDYFSHNSEEHVVIRRDGADFTFENLAPGSPFTQAAGSDKGCTFSAVSRCPVAGIERMVAFLGPMDDSLDIGLGRSA